MNRRGKTCVFATKMALPVAFLDRSRCKSLQIFEFITNHSSYIDQIWCISFDFNPTAPLAEVGVLNQGCISPVTTWVRGKLSGFACTKLHAVTGPYNVDVPLLFSRALFKIVGVNWVEFALMKHPYHWCMLYFEFDPFFYECSKCQNRVWQFHTTHAQYGTCSCVTFTW